MAVRIIIGIIVLGILLYLFFLIKKEDESALENFFEQILAGISAIFLVFGDRIPFLKSKNSNEYDVLNKHQETGTPLPYLPTFPPAMDNKYNIPSNLSERLLNFFYPNRKLDKLLHDCEITPSFQNKMALAYYYLKNEQYDKSIEIYKQYTHNDLFKNNIEIWEGLIKSYTLKGDWESAKTTLTHLSKIHPDKFSGYHGFLLAQVLEKLDYNNEAIKQYRKVKDSYNGEEPRYRLGLLLLRSKRVEEARNEFEDILKYTRFNKKYKQEQEQWIREARKEIRKINKITHSVD